MPKSESQNLAESLQGVLESQDAGTAISVLALALADTVKVFVEESEEQIDDSTKLLACVAVWQRLTEGAHIIFAGEGGAPMFKPDRQ